MKAVDTNVLIRYLVQDDPVQGRKAAAYIQTADSEGEQILIGNIILCETVWVLDSAYGFAKQEIGGALEKILRTSTFTFEDKDMVREALDDYRNVPKVDFADCLIGHIHKSFGCDPTATF